MYWVDADAKVVVSSSCTAPTLTSVAATSAIAGIARIRFVFMLVFTSKVLYCWGCLDVG